MRVALTLFGVYVAGERSIPGPCHFEVARNGWTAIPTLYEAGIEFKLVGIWERWDACWYTKIATFGYAPSGSETAFFPFFPALMRLVSPLFGGNIVLAGIAISTTALVLALWGVQRLAARDVGDAAARRAVMYIAIFPAAFFFFAPFTESLFLALAVWSMELARSGRWGAAGALGLLAGMTRPVGIFLALPNLWLALSSHRGTDPRSRGLGPWLAAAAPIVGFAVFTLFSVRLSGETPIDAQGRWWGSAPVHPPWEVIDATLAWIARTGDGLQTVNLALLVGAAILLVIGLVRLPIEYSLFAAPHVILAATRILPTPLTSTTRHLMIVFPLFVVLALLGERRRPHWTWVIASLLLLGLLAHAFLRGDFVA